jgi:REase_MTES_1575
LTKRLHTPASIPASRSSAARSDCTASLRSPSPAWSVFLKLLRDAGLPLPSANVFIAGFQLDMYWERERFAVELDGYEFHRSRSAFESDRRRQEDLKLVGIEMVRFTARRVVDHPQEVVGRVADFLDQRRSELLSGRSTAGTA